MHCYACTVLAQGKRKLELCEERQRGHKILRLIFLSHKSKHIILHVSVPVHMHGCGCWHPWERGRGHRTSLVRWRKARVRDGYMHVCECECVSECVSVSVYVCAWVCESVCECVGMSVCVCVMGKEGGRGRKERRDDRQTDRINANWTSSCLGKLSGKGKSSWVLTGAQGSEFRVRRERPVWRWGISAWTGAWRSEPRACLVAVAGSASLAEAECWLTRWHQAGDSRGASVLRGEPAWGGPHLRDLGGEDTGHRVQCGQRDLAAGALRIQTEQRWHPKEPLQGSLNKSLEAGCLTFWLLIGDC